MIGGLVELEVQGPHVVGPLGSEQLTAALGPAALALAGSGSSQALGAPQALGALAVDGPALPAQDGMRRLPAPTRMLSGDVAQTPAELVLFVGHRSAGQALSRPPLTGDDTRSSFGDPEAFHQGNNGPTAALRG